ncbi:hypothetical protein [Pontibacter pudoricolor]|uniref:hypothetical protein n=1 Tax=Pontibacter pudoricolor TaxID=2694930 RepID=UPI001391997F|nr:hypothetical protein [Pontibacter pudoricolor]
MNFDISDFINNLPDQITRQDLGTSIYNEIRAAENMKVGYLDQATENPEFYVNISRQLDTYIHHLKVFHNKVAPAPIAIDQELYKNEQPDLDQITKLMERIEESERNRHIKD